MLENLAGSVFEYLLTGVVAFMVGWTIRLEGKTNDNRALVGALALDLAKNYHSKEELRQTFEQVLGPIHKELVRLSSAVESRNSSHNSNSYHNSDDRNRSGNN